MTEIELKEVTKETNLIRSEGMGWGGPELAPGNGKHEANPNEES